MRFVVVIKPTCIKARMEAKNEVQGDDGLRGSGERGKKKGVHVVSVLSSSAMTAKYDEEGTATARGIERGSIAPLVPSAKKQAIRVCSRGTVCIFFLET